MGACKRLCWNAMVNVTARQTWRLNCFKWTTTFCKNFINVACNAIGFKIFWEGEGINEKGYIFKKNKKIPIIEVSDKYFRPTEVDSLAGNRSKAKSNLG